MPQTRLKKFVLHLGPHKTGTSFIQNSIREQLEGSLEKTKGVRHLTHRKKLAWLIGSQPKIKKLWAESGNDALIGGKREDVAKFAQGFTRILLKLSKYETVAVVAENRIGAQLGSENGTLYPYAENAGKIWGAVRKQLLEHGADMHIYASLRSQPAFIESTYVNLVRGGLHIPFNEYYGSLDLKSLSWLKFYDRLFKHFPEGAATIVPFEAVKQNPKAFIRSFTQCFETPLPVKHLSDNKRTGLSEMGLKVCYEAYYNIIDTNDRSAFAKLMLDRFPKSEWGAPELLHADTKARLKSSFEKDNRKLFDKRIDPSYFPIFEQDYAA